MKQEYYKIPPLRKKQKGNIRNKAILGLSIFTIVIGSFLSFALETKYDPIIDTVGHGFKQREVPRTLIYINQLSDFPAPVDTGDGRGVAIHLVHLCAYFVAADITTPYSIVAPDDYGFAYLEGNGAVTLTYTGTGAMYCDSNKKLGYLGVFNLFGTSPNGIHMDFESDDASVQSYVAFTQYYGFDIDTIGYIGPNTSVDIEFSGFLDFGDGLVFDSTDSTYIGSSSWWTDGKNRVGAVLLTVQGAVKRLIMSGFEFEIQSNETAFDIKSDSTIGGASVTAGAVTGAGTVFKAGSKTQADPYWRFSGVSGVTDSAITASYYARGNATATDITIRGYTQDFQSAEQSGSNTQINTTDTTGFSNGDEVWFPNTVYAGKYTISSLSVNTSFEINTTFGGTASGEYHRGWEKIAGTTIANVLNERSSMTGDNEITFTNIEDETLEVSFTYTVEGAATADEIEICIMNGGDILSESIKLRTLKLTPAEGMCTGVVSVSTGDTITCYVRNMDSATRDVLFSYFTFIGHK